MRRTNIFFTLLLAVAGAWSVASAQEREVAVTLQRGACFGSCPIYEVLLYTDGTVQFRGERYVQAIGERRSNIRPEVVAALVAGIAEAGYFDWNDRYTQMAVTDLPTITTSVTHNGRTQRIVRYAGDRSAPPALSYLEQWIDYVAYTQQWVGSETSLTNPAAAITLERHPCFGACPVYGLSVFDNGTVVYLGVDNVAVRGVRIAQIENGALDLLLLEARLSGYFNWQDTYTRRLITDQPTVVTSLFTEGSYKRIVRYDGDPDAPIGLVRFEDRIDRAVNVTQWVGGQP